MTLYLLRHGDAVESGYDDSSRPLSALGEQQAATVAAAFTALRLPLDAILSSPLQRARQMAEIISHKLGSAAPTSPTSPTSPASPMSPTSTAFLVPGTSEKQFFRQLNEMGKRSVLLIGHEPQLRTMASLLLCGSRQAQIEIRKATLLCIECARAVEPEAGVLKWMLRIEQMEEFRG